MNSNETTRNVNKSDLSESLEVLLRNFVNQSPIESDLGYCTGVVEDNSDPEKVGKIKVRVYEVYGESIATADLPWALPDNTYVGSTNGSFVVPLVGTVVNVRFDNESKYSPIYMTKKYNKNQLPSERLTDYPNTVVLWTSDAGDSVTYNRSTYLYQFRHASGLVTQIDKKGNLTVDTSVNSECNITVIANGKVQIQASAVEIVNDTGATVTPNPGLGGGFCALPNCVFSGAPHQGKIVNNCLVKQSDII